MKKYLAGLILNLALTTNAFAMAAPQGSAGNGGQAGGGMAGLLLPMIVVFAIFYLLMIRPQQKQQKKIKAMLEAMKKGDEVITRGGVHGRIASITDNIVILEIADNVRIKIGKEFIGVVRGEGVAPQKSSS